MGVCAKGVSAQWDVRLGGRSVCLGGVCQRAVVYALGVSAQWGLPREGQTPPPPVNRLTDRQV